MGATVWRGNIYISKELNAKLTHKEKLIVYAHEIWHEKHHDRIRKILLILTFIFLDVVCLCKGWIVPAMVVTALFVPTFNAYSRGLETLADQYSIQRTHDVHAFLSLLNKLDRKGPGYPSREASLKLARENEFS